MAELRSLPPISAALYGSQDATWTIKLAERRLVERCMSAAGFAYRAPKMVKPAVEQWPLPFGLEDLDAPQAAPQGQTPVAEEPSSEAYRKSLFGGASDVVTVRGKAMTLRRPAHGCQAAAETRLLGDGRERWMEERVLLHEADVEARERLASDGEFGELRARWQGCLRRAGFDYPDPAEALDAIRPGTELRGDLLARADVECKRKTDYLRIGYTRLAAEQVSTLAGEPTVLKDWTLLQDRQLAAAREVLTE